MEATLYWLLANGSYAILLGALGAATFGAPIPEDVVLLAGGALVDQGVTDLYPTVAVCLVGILSGDLFIYVMARHLGEPVLQRRPLNRLLTPRRRARLERLFDRHGGKAVFLARQLPGLRIPTFALAGLHGMGVVRFLAWDVSAVLPRTAGLMGLGYFFAAQLALVIPHLLAAQRVALAVAVVLGVALGAWLVWRRMQRRPNAG